MKRGRGPRRDTEAARRFAAKRHELTSDPERRRAFLDRGRRSSARSLAESAERSRREPGGFVVSLPQRRKAKEATVVLVAVEGRVSLVRPPISEPVDAMHLTPRSKGGCDHPDCVVAAGRLSVHRPYDDGLLDLLAFFTVDANRQAFLPELQHMLMHLSPVEMAEQLANDRVEWRNG